ncbi:MAG: hypothetical protein U9R75_02235, partial [Candidatus Thermoplasmatota archaeon]|nr:hypothetical protein [Candidatus Thermoplasmatota archaeon]
MDISGEKKKGAMAVLVLITLVLAGLIVVAPVPDVDAGMASERDEFGYSWTDNKDPDPKVEYNWLDVVTSGEEVLISGSYGLYTLPLDFDFEMYGAAYDEIVIGTKGFIIFDNSKNPSNYYSTGIPMSSSGLNGPMIHVCFGYPWTDQYSYGGVHYLESPSGVSPKWIAVEWNSNTYGMTYEVILYEGGLIKMQYNNMGTQTNYNEGQYLSAGVQEGDVYLAYTTYSTKGLQSGLAVEYSTEEIQMEDFKIVNGDGPFDHTAFAEHGYYEFDFNVSSSKGFQDVSLVKVYFGEPSENIFVKFIAGGGTWSWENGGGSQYYDCDLNFSRDMTTPGVGGFSAKLYMNFKLDIPLDGNLSVTLWGRGSSALPNMTRFEDAFYLDSVVKIVGNLQVLNERGIPLENEAFTQDNENLTFTGIKLMYNTTNEFYPPNSSHYFQVIDDEMIKHYDMNVSGRDMNIWFLMPNIAIRKIFTPSVRDASGNLFHEDKIIGTIDPIAFRVDDTTPIAPASLVIRADSFKDSEKEVDNDDFLFITWSSVTDSGSGVAGYRIWTTYAPEEEGVPWVDATTTQYLWNWTTEGVFKIFVWAEDGVGHYGDYADLSIKIDKKDPFFVEFHPLKEDVPWIRTLAPPLSIEVKDNLTISDGVSGVRPSTIEYSISTSGMDNFEEWISADQYDRDDLNPEDKITVKLSPRFIEGTENYVRYRAKDYAGNGFAYSDTYNLQVDVTPVAYQEFFPTPNVWHDLDVISNREVSFYLFDETSGIKTTQLYYRISDSYDEKEGEYNWVTGVPQENGWDRLSASMWDRIDGSKRIWVHFTYDGFEEGDQNFMQFMVKDNAGNGNYQNYFNEMMTLSPLYQIMVNTQPVAQIKAPTLETRRFEITELITFDASDSYDIDVDKGNLKYEWFVIELNKTIGYEEVLSDIRFDAAGWYNITLFVGDSVHRYDQYTGEDTRSIDSIRIEIFKWEPQEGIDT